MPSIIHVSNIPVETLPGKSVRGSSVLSSCIRLLEMQGVHERLGMQKAYGKIVKYLNSGQ